MKTFFLSLICCFSTNAVLGEDTVRLDPTFANFAVTATTSSTITLNTDLPTVQPTTEATAAKVYAPVLKNDTATNTYFLDSVNGLPTILDTTDNLKRINFPIQLNVSATSKYLYAAIKDTADSNKYKFLKQYSVAAITNVTNSNFVFPISLFEICAKVPTECTSLIPTSINEVIRSLKIYFFLSTVPAYGDGQEINTADATLNNGIYFDLGVSNKVLTPAEITVSLAPARRGDRRVILSFTSSAVLTDGESIRVFNHNGSTPGAGFPIGDGTYANPGAGLLPIEYPYAQNSEVTVNNLANGTTYTLSVLFVDKYKFATPLSNVVEGSPAEIQELLKENGCFLLTAGFGENHYVIDYFRRFRDQVLLTSWVGRQFVNVYYELAPKYALFIYENEPARAMIRGIAYTLYYAFNHLYLLILGTVLIPFLFVLKFTLRKIKILKA